MKKITVRVLFTVTALVSIAAVLAFAQEKKQSSRSKTDKNSAALIEEIPAYNSFINWTAGEVQTAVDMPMTEVSPNLGKTINRNYATIKDELRLNLIKAIGFVRISDIFQLKEYYSIKSDVRYEIVSKVDRAFYYPAVMANGKYSGRVKLDLYGKDGIASLFFRDIERIKPTNYVGEDKKDMEYFDGLILDMVSYPQFNPSIQMRIYDEDGNLLYGPETVNKDALEKTGVCEYTTSLSNAFVSPRSGHRVFYAIPFDIKGRMNTYIVLKNSDAARLFANPRTARYLNLSHVVVVKPLP